MAHQFTTRVYYEDTDMAGIVYYANYLRFIERARTEWVRSLGVDQNKLKSEEGVVFAVRKVDADYLSPAKFDDVLQITTSVDHATPARITLKQDVRRDGALLFTALVTLVALTDRGAPTRLPVAFRHFIRA